MTYSKKQIDFLSHADKAFNIAEGSVRSGKTWVNNIRFLLDLADGERRGYDSAIIGKTEQTIRRNIIAPLQLVLPDNAIKTGRNEVYIYGNRVYLIGANDIKAENKIRGMTLARLMGDELTTWQKPIFEMALTRLSVPGAKFFGTTNPDSPQHWFYKLYKHVIGGGCDEDTYCAHFTLDDNLTLTQEFKERLKRQHAGVFYDRFIEGLWCVAEGLIFDEYKPDEHNISSYNLAEYKEFIAGIDFGYSAPSAAYLIGVTRQNEFHIIKEFYKKNKLNIDLINWVKAQQEYIGKRINFIYCDSAEPDRIKEFQLKGFAAYKADKEVLASLNVGKTAFKNGKIKVYKDCVNLQNELQTLRWAQEGETGYEDEKTFIGDDHAVDAAIRYAIFTYSKRILHYK